MVSRLHRYHTVISQGPISARSRLVLLKNTHPLVKHSKFDLDCIAFVISQVAVILHVVQIVAIVANVTPALPCTLLAVVAQIQF